MDGSWKPPRLEGFPIDLFYDFWEIPGEHLCTMVENFISLRTIIQPLNATFLTLIPKENRANSHGNFRWISLCNMACRVISKVVTNKLKPLMDMIISKQRGGYASGRWQFFDGIISTYDLIHTMKTVSCQRILIKLGMFKAFDRLNVDFIE